jgi:hypothetical protein
MRLKMTKKLESVDFLHIGIDCQWLFALIFCYDVKKRREKKQQHQCLTEEKREKAKET